MPLRSVYNDTFHSLRNLNFRRYFIGQALSQNGTWMQLVAIDLLVLRLTDDGTAVGIATSARLAPILFLGAWGGLLSDRSDRHYLLIGLNAAGAAVAVAFAALLAAGVSNVMVIYLLAGLSGVVTALENPPRRAIVTDLVERRETTNAIGLNSAMMVSSKITGPAIAGAIIVSTSITWCFVVNAVSYVPQLWMFARMDRSKFQPRVPLERAKHQIRDGLRYIWTEQDLRLALVLVTATGAITLNFPVIYPLFAIRDLGGNEGTYSVLLSAMSVGSVVGALTIARRVRITNHYLALGAVALAAASAVLAIAPNLLLATLATVPVGIASTIINSGANSLVQLRSTPEMRGRVLALLAIVFVGSAPVAAPLIGWITDRAGARTALGLGAVTTLVAGAWTFARMQRQASTEAIDTTIVVVPNQDGET